MTDLTVTLASVPNCDFPAGQRGPRLATTTIAVASLVDASAECLAYIERNGLGGGNWTGGEVRDGGEEIGRVSYNGRVWPPEPWQGP